MPAPATTPNHPAPADPIEARLARQAAAQRRPRAEGKRLAGVLSHLSQRAVIVGLEAETVAAFVRAHEALDARLGTTPFTPQPRAEA